MSHTRSLMTSIPLRLTRIVRALLHVSRGWWMVRHHFSRIDTAQRDLIVKQWSRRLLELLGLRMRLIDAPASPPTRCVLVANHISWLDIMAICAHMPAVFVAKSELRLWPVAGTMFKGVGTLFIERSSARHARQINTEICTALNGGQSIVLFPEGATSEGDRVNTFHAALLQPAIETHAQVQPVAIRYCDIGGGRSDAAAYAGETTMLQSLWRIVSRRGLGVEIHFLPAVNAADFDRRALARHTEQLIATTLRLPSSRSRTGKPAGLPAAPRSIEPPTRSPYPNPIDSV